MSSCRNGGMLEKKIKYHHSDHGNRNYWSGGTFENDGIAATTIIRRQCRSGVMSEWKAVPMLR